MNRNRIGVYVAGAAILIGAALCEHGGDSAMALVLYVASLGLLVLPWALGGLR